MSFTGVMCDACFHKTCTECEGACGCEDTGHAGSDEAID